MPNHFLGFLRTQHPYLESPRKVVDSCMTNIDHTP